MKLTDLKHCKAIGRASERDRAARFTNFKKKERVSPCGKKNNIVVTDIDDIFGVPNVSTNRPLANINEMIDIIIENIDLCSEDIKIQDNWFLKRGNFSGNIYEFEIIINGDLHHVKFQLSTDSADMSNIFIDDENTNRVLTPSEFYKMLNNQAKTDGLYQNELQYMLKDFKNEVLSYESTESLKTMEIPRGRDYTIVPVFVEKGNDKHFVTVAINGVGNKRKYYIVDSNGSEDGKEYAKLLGLPEKSLHSLNEYDMQGNEESQESKEDDGLYGACGLFSLYVCAKADKIRTFNGFKNKISEILDKAKIDLESSGNGENIFGSTHITHQR